VFYATETTDVHSTAYVSCGITMAAEWRQAYCQQQCVCQFIETYYGIPNKIKTNSMERNHSCEPI